MSFRNLSMALFVGACLSSGGAYAQTTAPDAKFTRVPDAEAGEDSAQTEAAQAEDVIPVQGAQTDAAEQPAAEAQPSANQTLSVELNSATDTDAGNCRIIFVAENALGTALDRAAYEVAVFDAKGIVNRLLVLDFGALPENKTRVVQFEFPATKCADLSRMIVNRGASCLLSADKSESPLCLSNLKASSRADLAFSL